MSEVKVATEKLKAYYRTICSHCMSPIDLACESVKQREGAGRDIDGSMEGGHSETTYACPVCEQEKTRWGTIGSLIGTVLYKVFK